MNGREALDPITTGTAIVTGVQSTAALLRSAKSIVDDVRSVLPDGHDVPNEILRMVYLDCEYNIRVLEVMPQTGGAKGTDPAYFDYAHLLRTDAILALLLEWPNERSYSVQGILSQKKYWSEKASKLRQKDLLSLARQVLVACQTLQAISHVSPKVRNKTQVRTRLKNVKVWLEMLRAVMIEEERLKDITHPAPRLR